VLLAEKRQTTKNQYRWCAVRVAQTQLRVGTRLRDNHHVFAPAHVMCGVVVLCVSVCECVGECVSHLPSIRVENRERQAERENETEHR